jgi:uncharacterized repeat protein (TIGR04138 family)
MQSAYFEEILDAIIARDDRFAREAYHFVREALDHTQRKIYPLDKVGSMDGTTENRHVSGQQLLEGIREYGLQSFGPMTLTVFEAWGIHRCEDFGEIVFNLVDHGRGMFGKTDTDSREDFREGYNFREVFERPFLPAGRRRSRPHQMREA